MKKKLLFGLTAAAFGAAVIAATPAQAVTGDTANSMKTEAGIGFLTYNPGSGPFQNNLALTFVPSSFNFGNANKVSANAQTFAQQDTPIGGQYLGVSDDRNTKTSWNVTATLADFVNSKDETDKLENASIVMNMETVQKYNFNAKEADEAGYATPDPSASGSLTSLDANYASLYSGITAGNITLNAGSTAGTKVLNYNLPANTTAQTGTAAVARKISNVNLNVKGGSATENSKYSSTIKWVLSDDAA